MATQLPSPWTNMQDLLNLYGPPDASGDNASYDPSVQASINSQNTAASDQQDGSDVNSFLSQPMPQGGGGMSSSRPADMSGINRLLGQMDSRNLEGVNLQKDEIERLKKYRDQMPQGSEGPDLTGLMALADAWGDGSGKVFTGSYKRPDTEEERAAKKAAVELEIAKQGGTLTNEELGILKDKLSGEVAKLHYGQQKDAISASKAADNEEKDANSLIKFYDTERTGGRMSPVLKAQSNLNQAQRIQALVDQYKDDPNQMPLTGPASLSEVAIGLNSLLSSSGGSEESRKSLIPASAQGKFSTVEQWINNKPQGAEMAEFVKNAQDTLNREVATNAKQVNVYKERIKSATGGGRLAKSNPERYKAITDAFLNSPSTADPAAPQVAAPGGLPATVQQHGYEYELGTDGKYHKGRKL